MHSLCRLHKLNALAFDHSAVSFEITSPLRSLDEKECTMMNLRLIGAIALALTLVGPAMAGTGGYGMDKYDELYRPQKMPAQDAIRFGYGNVYPTYHSGWGGLYGDGEYPGSVD